MLFRSVDAANGAILVQWDDDDLYAPDRIAVQRAALGNHDAAFLERWMLWQPSRLRLGISMRRVWEGSVMVRRSAMPRYPSLAIGEDHHVTQHLCAEHDVVLIDAPRLYVYTAHGNNTCGPRHFEQLYANATRQFEFGDYDNALKELELTLPVIAYANAIDRRAH